MRFELQYATILGNSPYCGLINTIANDRLNLDRHCYFRIIQSGQMREYFLGDSPGVTSHPCGINFYHSIEAGRERWRLRLTG